MTLETEPTAATPLPDYPVRLNIVRPEKQSRLITPTAFSSMTGILFSPKTSIKAYVISGYTWSKHPYRPPWPMRSANGLSERCGESAWTL